jgi:predicted dehydrogenase
VSRLKIAVVGAGHLGRFHARVAANLPDARLVAVVDPVAAAREQVAAEVGAKPLADFHDLIGLADAAIVATPTAMHHAVARELLLSGIHVLVEKPITTTLAQADELVNLAERQQLVLQVGHIERFNPAFTAVSGRLSDPKYITARRMSTYTFRSTDIGVVLDLMIHDIDAVLSLVPSPVIHVEAVGLSVMGHEEDIVDARLHFASGCIANITASRVSYESVRSMQIFTDNCCATIDFGARKARLVEPTAEMLSRQFDVDALTVEQKNQLREHLFEALLVKSEVAVTDCNAMEQEQLDFARAIRTNSEPQVSGTAGRDALAIAQEVVSQIGAHRWDGLSSRRMGPLAMPHSDSIFEPLDPWSAGDTVILRRKAG